MGTAAKVQRNYQITLPASVRKQAHVRVGDLVDFEVREDGILIKPLATVERSQMWFWSKRWQEEERKVQEDFRKGRVKVSKSSKEFLDELDK
jgi:AbrB family looped-hinge helix DNA binding protein